jgi:DNA-directed RNA polymerase subunit alpha
MMLDFQPITQNDSPADEEEEAIPTPTVTVIESDDRYGKFVIEPIQKGNGITIGNPLRRMLYSSLPGTAITWVKIEDILHEYTTMPHVKEEVSEFLLNVKGIRLKSAVERPGKLRLEVAGRGEVCAGDIMASSDFEVVNPELHLATLDSDEAKLSVEFNVERGTGYKASSHGQGLPIGVLPVDAVYTPIRKVNFNIESMRVGQHTDFERLILEVWTDGSITPIDALRQAANVLITQLFLIANTQIDSAETGEGIPAALRISPEQYNTPVESLNLASRTLNCLKRSSIDKVGEILVLKKSDLLKIRNFGEKSANELYDKLRELDMLPADLDPNLQDDQPSEIENDETNTDPSTNSATTEESE